jgi:hypothetical protein
MKQEFKKWGPPLRIMQFQLNNKTFKAQMPATFINIAIDVEYCIGFHRISKLIYPFSIFKIGNHEIS